MPAPPLLAPPAAPLPLPSPAMPPSAGAGAEAAQPSADGRLLAPVVPGPSPPAGSADGGGAAAAGGLPRGAGTSGAAEAPDLDRFRWWPPKFAEGDRSGGGWLPGTRGREKLEKFLVRPR